MNIKEFDFIDCFKVDDYGALKPLVVLNQLKFKVTELVSVNMKKAQPLIEEKLKKYQKIMENANEFANYYQIVKHWKETGNKERDKIIKLGIKTTHELKDYYAKKILEIKEINIIFSKLIKTGYKTRKQWVIIRSVAIFNKLLSVAFTIFLSILSDIYLGESLKYIVNKVSPKYANFITIITVSIILYIIVDNLFVKLQEKILWLFYEKKCEKFNTILKTFYINYKKLEEN